MSIRENLLPRAYIVVAPQGRVDLSKQIANAICTFKSEAKKVPKFTVVDAMQICKSGQHGGALEEKLIKALFTAEQPDALPVTLWAELFQEAFVQSANPMGTFLVTNFPTPCSVGGSPTIRDQFGTLESICTVAGILNVRLSDTAFQEMCDEDGRALIAYTDFAEKVRKIIEVQYKSGTICDSTVESASNTGEVAKVAAEFMAFKEKKDKKAA